MIVHMTGLYTKLVTYAKLHILILVACLQLYQLSFISTALFMLLLFSYLLFLVLNLLLFCTHCLYARALHFFLHTHQVSSDGPEFVRPNTGCFMLLIRCSMRLDMLQGAGVSFYLFWYYFFLFILVDSVVFLILYLLSVVILFLYSGDIMCGRSYIVLQ